MGIFDSINNPWAPGGQMSPELPWASPGLSYGWGHGNEFFTPKTKEQINKEAMLQLAVLAAILVAPAIVGAAGGAGAGASAGAGGSAAGAVGGTAAESAGAVLTQGAVTAAGGGATAAAVGGGAAASSGLIAGLGMAAALQPFLQEDSSKALQQAAMMGENELTQELKRRSKKDCKCTPKPKFASDEWERKHRDCKCGEDEDYNTMKQSQIRLGFLERLAEEIGKDVNLQRSLRKRTRPECCSNAIPNAEFAKLTRLAERIVPEFHNVKVLRSPIEPIWPKKKERIDGPSGFRVDPSNNKIVGTIYLTFDDDFDLGRFPDETMNEEANAALDSILGIFSSNEYRENPIVAEIAVIPVPPGTLPPTGAHVFVLGNGNQDPKWDKQEKRPNPNMSWATIRGKDGYLYDSQDAGHETLHWLGLTDRYTEVVDFRGDYSTGTLQLPRALWGRYSDISAPSLPRVMPLANVQPTREGMDYEPCTNVMSVRGSTLTQYQLSIIFSDNIVEPEYDKDVVAVGPYWEDRYPQEAVEFVGRDAFWWDCTADRRKNSDEFVFPPTTIRRLGALYFGQNTAPIESALRDRDHTLDFGNLSKRIRNSHKDINNAISHNR